ncbi:cGMP-dependent protein kinase 1-like [Clavelina lepadiformis]|uniref:Protein kinase domain-containing protein n=1 Tax=Clavelina lepadiformis TaxID=159417 RepID=A0ABP0GZA9_CLALP
MSTVSNLVVWDDASTDSGFCSDVERRPCQPTSSRRQKTKSLYGNDERCLNQGNDEKDKTKDSSKSLPSRFRKTNDCSIIWNEITLNDFDYVRNLGGGGYARVDLVRLTRHKNEECFALKKINKKLVLEAKQQRQFEAEKDVLMAAKSRFIPMLYKTFSSSNHVYLLTEACLGGDLFSYLERFGPMHCSMARFVIACAVEALDYLHHALHVIHRDVKTENLLIGEHGILKLADLGFCKTVDPSHSSTYTFCGTPGYIAPEVLLDKGHSFSADYFSLGVVAYEILTCRSPFRRLAIIDTYKATIRGITDVAFPNNLDHVTRSFVRGLCYREPERRLGPEIHSHEWFYGFSWLQLRAGNMVSPLCLS